MLSVVNLTKVYKKGTVKALDSVNLSIGDGEVLGLIGPNGAGKTTLMECMLGLIWPTSGEVRINGLAPTHIEVRKITAFLPERAKYDPWMTAREFLAYQYMLARGTLSGSKARIEEILDEVELQPDARKRRIKTYSKGMLQRLGLAQMMVGNPQICFMDEPTSGLDPVSRNIVRDAIRKWKEQNVTVIINSHNLDEVERVCDRVAFVSGGRIATVDQPEANGDGEVCAVLRWLGPDDAAERLREIAGQSGLTVHVNGDQSASFVLRSRRQLPPLVRSLVNAQIDV
ncbi:MAG TPA: ABC transporter ATP-binding protein, partial [Candidatus Obscuribacterales bacterium]